MKLWSFSGAWCQPCQQQKPIVKKFIETHPDVVLNYCDVSEPAAQSRANNWMISSVPTLVLTDDQENVLAAQPGFHDTKRLEALYKQACAR